jgi:ABC-2 type transport system ATP-binding protein
MTSAVEAEDLRKSYKGAKSPNGGRAAKGAAARDGVPADDRVHALDGLSFSVAAGSVYALLGPNGAGKTTTVRILTTLSRPDSGQASVAGIDVLAQPARVRAAIGAVSQHSGAVGLLTGAENLAMQGGLHGLRGRELRRRTSELLDAFSLTEAANRQVKTYSGGMRRRLDIATVLVHRPTVLFLDEPTTGLDPEGRTDLWAVLTELAAGGTTILVTTHYLEEADQYADQVAIVDRGRIVAEGTSDELKAGLHGDSVLLELDSRDRAEQAEKILIDIPQVAGVAVDDSSVRARVADGARALPAVIGGLEASSVPVRSVTVARPSLDDVYLHHAGRSFRQAEKVTVS